MPQHPYLAPHPIAIAHRGGAGDAPENTMAAFSHAIDLGYSYLETDVHLTRDGVVVAFHDDRLDRVTDRSGLISDLGIDEVETADAGYRFSTDSGQTFPYRGRGERIPRLEHLLTTFHNARVNIDPKNDAVALGLLSVLRNTNAFDRVCVGSFSDRRLRLIRQFSDGRACTSMGPRAASMARLGSWLGLAPRSGADCVQLPISSHGVRLVDRRFIEACHHRAIPVHVWTVNTESEMEWLLDLGVDGIMSDRPAVLADIFRKRGLALDGRQPERAR